MNITCASDLTLEDMTEASERIYKEVGESADIIWGTAVDDSLGDEIRVTVIATGIGSGPESTKEVGPIEPALRGRVRDITPADLEGFVDYDEPTFIRRKKAVGDPEGFENDGYKGIVIDSMDLDVPTFLRKKAD